MKTRILTALVLVPLAMWAVLGLSTGAFAVFLAVFVLIGAWEWAVLAGARTAMGRAAFVLLTAMSLIGFGAWMSLGGADARSAIIVFSVLSAGWLLALIELILVRDVRRGMMNSTAGRWLTGLAILAGAWLSMVWLHGLRSGHELALAVFVIVWTADSAAYFAGRRFGKHKLAPHVSPGKTLEGVAGGVLAVLPVALCWAVYPGFAAPGKLTWWLLLAILTALMSVVGDLTESRYKRAAGVKDSGTLFPGHGGVLDRIDALTAAAPVFALGATLLTLDMPA